MLWLRLEVSIYQASNMFRYYFSYTLFLRYMKLLIFFSISDLSTLKLSLYTIIFTFLKVFLDL